MAVNCVVEAPHACSGIYPHVLRWCLALLDDTGIKPGVRSFATDRAVYLTVWKKDYRRALEIIASARRAEPGNGYFAFLAADVHYRAGELDEAERVARTIRNDYPVRGLREKTDQLLSSIAAARAVNQ
jgi:predicted Zn-dependent protease